MKNIQIFRQIFDLEPNEIMPKNLINAIMESWKLESISAKGKTRMIYLWDSLYNKLKSVGKTKREVPHEKGRVRFAEAHFHNPSDPAGEAEVEPVSDKLNRLIPSATILEKFIEPLFAIGSSLGFSSKWNSTDAPSIIYHHDGLRYLLLDCKVTIEQLTKDLKKIISRFEKGKAAVLGYKCSFKISPNYPDYVLRRIPNFWGDSRLEWIPSGKTFPRLPKYKLFLIKVVQDREFSAKTIQTAWKKYRLQRYCSNFATDVIQSAIANLTTN